MKMSSQPLASTLCVRTGITPGVSPPAAIANAVGLRASQPEDAERQAKVVAKALPGDGRALYVIGAARRRAGNLDESKRILIPLAAARDESAQVHFDLALWGAVACECGAEVGALRRGADLEAN
jgi:hypothetical protein